MTEASPVARPSAPDGLHEVDGKPPLPDGTLAVHVLFERSSGAGAWAHRWRAGTHLEALRIGATPHGGSRRRLEMRAIRDGLESALRDGVHRATIEVSDRRGGAWLARLLADHMVADSGEARRLTLLAGLFSSVEVRVVEDLHDPALVRTAARALDSVLAGRKRARAHRIRDIESRLARAARVRIERTEDGFLAQGRYHVRLDPPSCECPAWTRRWRDVPLAGRRTSRLPCKHLLAAARAAGELVPADLEVAVRKARA